MNSSLQQEVLLLYRQVSQSSFSSSAVMGTLRMVSCRAVQLLQMRTAGEQADSQDCEREELRSQPRLQKAVCYMKSRKRKDLAVSPKVLLKACWFGRLPDLS